MKKTLEIIRVKGKPTFEPIKIDEGISLAVTSVEFQIFLLKII